MVCGTKDPTVTDGCLRFVLYGIIHTAICCLGLVGNGISAFVLSRPSLKSSINRLLLGLAFVDSIFLVTQFLILAVHYIVFDYVQGDFWFSYFNFYNPFIYRYFDYTSKAAKTASAYFTVAISLERYVVVCHPLRAFRICTTKTAGYTAIGIILASLVYALPFLFAFEAESYVYQSDEDYYEDDSSESNSTSVAENKTELIVYKTQRSSFGRSHAYQEFAGWGFIVVNFGIPFLSIIILNVAIFRAVKRADQVRRSMTQSQLKELSIAKMLIIVVLLYGICYWPLSMSLVLRTTIPHTIFKYILSIGEVLTSVNSAGNFIIYYAMNPNFRLALLTTFASFCGKRLNFKIRERENHSGSAKSTSTQISKSTTRLDTL